MQNLGCRKGEQGAAGDLSHLPTVITMPGDLGPPADPAGHPSRAVTPSGRQRPLEGCQCCRPPRATMRGAAPRRGRIPQACSSRCSATRPRDVPMSFCRRLSPSHAVPSPLGHRGGRTPATSSPPAPHILDDGAERRPGSVSSAKRRRAAPSPKHAAQHGRGGRKGLRNPTREGAARSRAAPRGRKGGGGKGGDAPQERDSFESGSGDFLRGAALGAGEKGGTRGARCRCGAASPALAASGSRYMAAGLGGAHQTAATAGGGEARDVGAAGAAGGGGAAGAGMRRRGGPGSLAVFGAARPLPAAGCACVCVCGCVPRSRIHLLLAAGGRGNCSRQGGREGGIEGGVGEMGGGAPVLGTHPGSGGDRCGVGADARGQRTDALMRGDTHGEPHPARYPAGTRVRCPLRTAPSPRALGAAPLRTAPRPLFPLPGLCGQSGGGGR